MMTSAALRKVPIVASSLIFPIIVGLLLGLYNLSNADEKDINGNDGWCIVKKADKLNIAFVLDRTKSYEPYGTKLAKNILPKVVDILKSQYKEVSYALTTFADYTDAQGPIVIPRTDPVIKDLNGRDDSDEKDERTNDTGCYEFKMDFDSNAEPVLDAISTLKYIKSGGSGEASFTALLFTAADKKLSWTETPQEVDISPTSSGTFKTMVLLTEETSTQKLRTDNARIPVKGDGTDTCEATKLPTPANIMDALGKNNIHVVAIVNESGSRNEIEETWIEFFKMFNISEPEKKIYQWGDDGITEDEDVDGIVAAITSSLGQECEMEDPPPNNMLGL
ncbi:unnamed protein product [Orchesella dallaii]|uniref:VWFA domain-containing protein n=1 Tax=Orchesella dallaii TaxID=48710 RepID=A0ABP1R9K0_9HEXA